MANKNHDMYSLLYELERFLDQMPVAIPINDHVQLTMFAVGENAQIRMVNFSFPSLILKLYKC